MLKTACIQPQIMAALALCGHGDRVLLADGNYPLVGKSYREAERAYLGLTAGIPTVPQVLQTISGVINIEAAAVMQPEGAAEPEVFAEFHELLPDLQLEKLNREEFYAACQEPALKLAVATGEQRVYANILLTVGVV